MAKREAHDVEDWDLPGPPLVPRRDRSPDEERPSRLEALLLAWFRDETTRRAILDALRAVVGRD